MAAAGYRLIIGNRNYSSWSLRAWLAFRLFDIPFEDVQITFRDVDGNMTDAGKAELLALSPTGLVPVLEFDGIKIWESLAILETLAERHPERGMWPTDPRARAIARSVSAEMHAGFGALRGDMQMDFARVHPARELSEDVIRDIARIVEIWRSLRSEHQVGGAFLFGTPSLVDVMYAPVASRFRTYSVDLKRFGDDGSGGEYAATLLGLPQLQQWADGAQSEIRAT